MQKLTRLSRGTCVLLFLTMCGFLSLPGAEPAAAAQVIVVALGASQTAGKGVSSEEAYPAQLETMLRAKGRDVIVQNAGINGDTTGGMLDRLDSAVPEGTRVVILQPGGNDRRHGLGAERDENIQKMTSALRARKIKVVMIENSMLHELPPELHQPDGQHFTAEGYRVLAARILPQVVRAMGR